MGEDSGETEVRSLLREAGACLKPWVIVGAGDGYVVLYDYLRGVVASLEKQSLEGTGRLEGVAEALIRLGFALPGCGDVAFTDLTPGSPTTYALETGLGFYVERLSISVPLGGNDPLDAGGIPYPCESYVVPEAQGVGVGEALDALAPLLERYVPVMRPASIVLSFGRLEGVVDDVVKLSGRVLERVRSYGARLSICVHHDDYLRYWGVLRRVFSSAIVTYVSDGSPADFRSALSRLAGSGSVEKIVAYAPPNRAAEMLDTLVRFSRLRAVPPTFVVPDSLAGGAGRALTQFLMPPPLQNLPPVIHALIAPCKHSNLCFAVIGGGLKAAPCKWGHIHGGGVEALSDGDIAREALREVIRGWREAGPCRSCGFRIVCGFCREFVRSAGVGGGCPLRDAFFRATRLPTPQ